MTGMEVALSAGRVALILFLLLTSSALFLWGFMLKAYLTSAVENEQRNSSDSSRCHLLRQPPNITVFMVIDAWRHSFLTADDMPFIHSSVHAGDATVFETRVQSPTVTLPRIQAMTTGRVPSFASVLFNYHSSQSLAIDWLSIFKEQNDKRRVVFYGDDTWLRLFPRVFEKRSEGVTSFFVNDYTEVDLNVSRHLVDELNVSGREAADLLVLHYLGLDHIGHSLGGESEMIPRKLREMDDVVHLLHSKLSSSDRSFVLVVVGDHGMTSSGSHGGSSPSETLVPLVVFDKYIGRETARDYAMPAEEGDEIEQVDVASSLPHLLAIPAPSSSLGISFLHRIKQLHPEFAISALAADTQRLMTLTNVDTEKDLLAACTYDLSSLMDRECSLRSDRIAERNWKNTAEICYLTARKVQRHLITDSNELDSCFILAGLAIAVVAVLLFVHPVYSHLHEKTFSSWPPSLPHFLHFFVLAHFLSLFASSLVEEEHDVWFFFFSTACFLYSVRAIHRLAQKLFLRDEEKRVESEEERRDLAASAAALLFHRIASSYVASRRRRWNLLHDELPPPLLPDPVWISDMVLSLLQTAGGYNGTNLPDLFTLLSNSPKVSLWVTSLSCAALMLLIVLTHVDRGDSTATVRCRFVLLLSATAAVVCRHAGVLSEPNSCRIVWMICLLVILSGTPSLAAVAYFVSLSRREGVILLLLSFGIGSALRRLHQPLLVVIALSTSFFYSGTGNSLASVDIAPGYAGLSSYLDFIVAFQILAHMYSAPLVLLIAAWDANYRRNGGVLTLFVILLRTTALSGCQAALLFFSSHLFVWTVFAPKFLFEVLHSLIITVLISSIGAREYIRSGRLKGVQ